MSGRVADKPLMWLHGELRTPPMGQQARLQAGYLLRLLQRGDALAMPASRPMPVIGSRCHELRVPDRGTTWRVIYRADADAVLLLAVFRKKTRTTPRRVLHECRRRLKRYDDEKENPTSA